MTPEMWTTLGLGFVMGWWVGREVAERRRARFDGETLWRNRSRYRGKERD